jgi:hypothetical protein
MDPDALFVTWTMDCETIGAESPTGGPVDWQLSERAMRGYVGALAERGHRATLFLIPRLAEAQAEVLMELREAGAELGMHMHPQTADLGHDRYLGQYSADEQREMLRAGRDRVHAAVGQAPRSFRPGNFSASDDTFAVLGELGFTQGSVSLPGRVIPDFAAEWGGAEPFAHWASATNRLETGDLGFLELPCAVDLREVESAAKPPGEVTHLRLERDGILQWGPDLIRRHLAAQVESGCQLKSLVVMTHNTREYGDARDTYRGRLEGLADAIEEAAAEAGLTVCPATLAQIRALVT